MKVLVFFLLISSLFARDVIQKDGYCSINWTKGYLVCSGTSEEGQSEYAATLSAKVIAQRNMLEFVKGVRIDSTTTIKDGMLQSDIIKASVKWIIRGARVVNIQYEKEKRRATVQIKVSLYKDILNAILNPKIASNDINILQKFLSIFLLHAGEYNYEDLKTLKKLLQDFKQANNKEAEIFLDKLIKTIQNNKFTGVVIDASQVNNFDLAMIPKIRTSDGKEIYPKKFLTKESLIEKNGPVSYEIGLKDAIKNKRVYNKPVFLKANKVYGKRYSDLVLDKKSSNLLNNIDKTLFKEAKIVILVGEWELY